MRICSGAGCLRKVREDVRFCDDCQPTRTASDIKIHSHAYDETLDNLRKGTRWQKLRATIVRRQPLCARCELSITEIVDHVVPAREAISQAQLSGRYIDKFAGYFLESNLQGLCRPCHWVKTNEDKAHTGPWPDVLAKEDAAPKRRFSF